jgi:hypothetical protein
MKIIAAATTTFPSDISLAIVSNTQSTMNLRVNNIHADFPESQLSETGRTPLIFHRQGGGMGQWMKRFRFQDSPGIPGFPAVLRQPTKS